MDDRQMSHKFLNSIQILVIYLQSLHFSSFLGGSVTEERTISSSLMLHYLRDKILTAWHDRQGHCVQVQTTGLAFISTLLIFHSPNMPQFSKPLCLHNMFPLSEMPLTNKILHVSVPASEKQSLIFLGTQIYLFFQDSSSVQHQRAKNYVWYQICRHRTMK